MINIPGNVTHTFVIMDLATPAFNEILAKMREAGWDHAIMEEDGRTVIDMHGIAVAENKVVTYPDQLHPSHQVRVSMDASSYDHVCINCGETDQVPGGWGKLKEPCVLIGAPGKYSDDRKVREAAYEEDRKRGQASQVQDGANEVP